MPIPAPIVTIFGGSGFLGRHIAQRMARAGWRVRVAVRRPNEALFVRTYGAVGQVEAVQANIRDEASTRRAIAGAQAVVNCVGILGRGRPPALRRGPGRGRGPRRPPRRRGRRRQAGPDLRHRRRPGQRQRLCPHQGRGRGRRDGRLSRRRDPAPLDHVRPRATASSTASPGWPGCRRCFPWSAPTPSSSPSTSTTWRPPPPRRC